MGDGRLGRRIDVGAVLPAERAALLDLLADLDASGWQARAPGLTWSVHELAVHLLHDDLRRLSAERDGHEGPWIDAASLDELVAGLDELNERFVATMAPTLSPQLTVELLAWSAAPTLDHLHGLPPDEPGGTVAWAGAGPHPHWLDVAREYTERWVHQQQIREALAQPGLDDELFVAPVVETFARALPVTLPPAPEGTRVVVGVEGPFERSWALRRDGDGWVFTSAHAAGRSGQTGSGGPADRPDARLTVPVEVFWRRAVRAIDGDRARQHAVIDGDSSLVVPALDLRAAIVAD